MIERHWGLAGSPADVLLLSYPKMTPGQLLARLPEGLGIDGPPRQKLALVEAIGGRLRDLHRNARRPVLVVDEAQLASPSLLEEIRLRVAGGDVARTFSPEAVDTLGERSGGVPRRLNTLATHSLFVGAMRSPHQIDAELVRDVADDQE